MRTDFFNEAIVTAMLASSGNGAEGATPGEEDVAQAVTLRERLTSLMDQADRAAIQAGIPGDLAEAADFAVCAFIDEALLSSTAWSDRLDWLKRPLQFVRHGTATAGEEFYRLLDSLLEEAEKKAPVPLPSETDAPLDLPTDEESGERDVLHAVLEIFALCLAQGFTGMFYNDPKAIQDKLENIGRFVPAVRQRVAPLSFAYSRETKEQGFFRKAADIIRRFDVLDWLLWIVPPVLTALFYGLCVNRLDQMLQPFLQGNFLQ